MDKRATILCAPSLCCCRLQAASATARRPKRASQPENRRGAALLHCLGAPQADVQPVEISVGGIVIGTQKLLLASPDTSFCVTALNQDRERYGEQLRRFLRHTPLNATQWINVDRHTVTFTTIRA